MGVAAAELTEAADAADAAEEEDSATPWAELAEAMDSTVEIVLELPVHSMMT